MDSQLQIFSDNLKNLKLYPIWSSKRHLYIIQYRKYINDFITPHHKLLRDLWRKRTCECKCGMIVSCQSFQNHKKSKKHINFINNIPPTPDKIICECGGKYLRKNNIQHFNTKKHLLFLQNKE